MVATLAGAAEADRAQLARSAAVAAAWRAHALADLDWHDRERLSEAVRADATECVAATVREALVRLTAALDRPVDEQAVLTVLRAAGWSSPALVDQALRAAEHRALSARLMASARPFGATDPLDELAIRSGRTGTLARALRDSESDRPTSLVLAAEPRHELCWAVAAALRVAAQTAESWGEGDDARLHLAARDLLVTHDEASAPGAIAARLARRLSPDRLMPGEALLAGRTRLAVAVLSERTGVDAVTIEDWLLGPDSTAFAVTLRAAGEDPAGVGALLATLAHAGRRPAGALADLIERLRHLSEEDAATLLATAS